MTPPTIANLPSVPSFLLHFLCFLLFALEYYCIVSAK